MSMTLTVFGMNKLKTRLANLKNQHLTKACVEGTKQIARDIRDTAKILAPKDTGALAASIRLIVTARPAGHVTSIGVSAGGYVINPKTGRRVDYASFVEYGTRNMRAQPFMRPAIAEHTPRTTRIITKGIRETR